MKTKKTTKKNKEFHLISYVLDSSPKLKKFSSVDAMAKFVEKFHRDHPEHMSSKSGDWIDFVITNITGKVTFFTDGIDLE